MGTLSVKHQHYTHIPLVQQLSHLESLYLSIQVLLHPIRELLNSLITGPLNHKKATILTPVGVSTVECVVSIYTVKPCYFQGGLVASWLVLWTPDQVIRVRALARDIIFCSWTRHFTLTVNLSPPRCLISWIRNLVK